MSKQIRKFTKKNKVNQRKRERRTLGTIEEMDEIIVVPPWPTSTSYMCYRILVINLIFTSAILFVATFKQFKEQYQSYQY